MFNTIKCYYSSFHCLIVVSTPGELINGNISEESSETADIEMTLATPCPAYATTQFTDTQLLEYTHVYVDIQL